MTRAHFHEFNRIMPRINTILFLNQLSFGQNFNDEYSESTTSLSARSLTTNATIAAERSFIAARWRF